MPVDIHRFLRAVRQDIRPYRLPVVGHYTDTPFTVLISCILSLRTQDKTTDAASERLFRLAKTPRAMANLPLSTIQKAIYPVSFYRNKAKSIKQICAILLKKYRGNVPETIEELVELPGVGRKTANLTVTLGYGKPGICVDTHVHRITNRWGYLKTKSPDETEMALRAKLPKKYWIGINEWLVTFGQNLCQPVSPLCSRCKLRPDCSRLGVIHSR
jgi:endonuclease-3